MKTTDIQHSFIVRSLPRKGQGLIAAQNIPKGHRILSEKPRFTISSIGYNHDLINQLIAIELKKVSKDNQRALFNLHNNFRGSLDTFLGIVKKNALPLGPGISEGELFLLASRINYACLPKCQNTWNTSTGEETIHAVREIAKGEEITTAYSDVGPSQHQRLHLKSNFGFECSCNLCGLPAPEQVLSDDRWKEIQHLDVVIGDGAHLMQHPQQHLQNVRKLILLLESEEISDARLARAYYDVFQTVTAHGNMARAKVFAEKAYAARLCCEGEDSPGTLRMKLLAGNPKSHRLFGTTKKWIQNEKKIPERLGDEEFEKWLWKQNV